jgi:hypothetical protein
MIGNIVDLALQPFGPQVLDAVAMALGLDRQRAESAVDAAVPAFLSALLWRLELPGGRQAVADALDEIDESGLERLAGLIGSGERQSLVDGGTQLLAMLLGRPAAATLTSAVAGFTGLGQGRAQSLLGMVAPAVMGVLRRRQAAQGLDLEGLAAWLAAQRTVVVSAVPSGMVGLLEGVGPSRDPGDASELASSS